MARPLLMLAGGALIALGGLQVARAVDLIAPQAAFASSSALLDGCGDVPEAVELAETLRLRGIAIDRALADLAHRKDELAAAESRVRERLVQLREARKALAEGKDAQRAGTDRTIARLVAVYNAMKPADAAHVLAALPPDFAADILSRVEPDAGARIMAAVDPGQAAILTAHMGARRLPAE